MRKTRQSKFINSKFQAVCKETGLTIEKGEKCLYMPLEKSVFHITSKEAQQFAQSMPKA